MKKLVVMMLSVMFMMGIQQVNAENKNDKFKVSGNCGMCEKRIEKAAKDVAGVTKADWNKDTKEMTLTFDNSKTSVDKVQASIAKAGYDTPLHKAEAKDYKALPECCQYDREAAKK
jgi:copper chaperone CopZ